MNLIHARSVLLRTIRNYFYENNFLEVETPIIVKTPCMEEHIDAIKCESNYLRTSPELYHKRLLSNEVPNLFEIGKCFRANEKGSLHHPEYTMLEWYIANSNYLHILNETTNLLVEICRVFKKPLPEIKIFSVEEIFLKLTNWNPIYKYNSEKFEEYLSGPIVEYFKQIGGAIYLKDYPIQAAALSRISSSNRNIAERWELYLDGMEIANAYSELINEDEQRKRFNHWGEKRRQIGKEVYPLDEDFLSAMKNMPESTGCALGIDRLLLWILNKKDLSDVLYRNAF